MFKKLHQNFKEVMSKGLNVSFSWLCTKANVISKEFTQNLKRLSQAVVAPAGNYMFKVNNRNTRTRCEICSKLTIKTPERRH